MDRVPSQTDSTRGATRVVPRWGADVASAVEEGRELLRLRRQGMTLSAAVRVLLPCWDARTARRWSSGGLALFWAERLIHMARVDEAGLLAPRVRPEHSLEDVIEIAEELHAGIPVERAPLLA